MSHTCVCVFVCVCAEVTNLCYPIGAEVLHSSRCEVSFLTPLANYLEEAMRVKPAVAISEVLSQFQKCEDVSCTVSVYRNVIYCIRIWLITSLVFL